MTDAAISDSVATTTGARWWNIRRRRRVLVSLVLVCVAVGAIGWWITHRHDSRLVGRWLFTRGAVPTLDELRWLPAGNRPGDRLEWTFEADGTGRQLSEQWVSGTKLYGFSAFSWWTDGERVFLKWGDPQQGWAAVKHTYADIRRVLQGETLRQPDVYAYSAAAATEGDAQQFVLQFQNDWDVPQDDIYYLTRIPPE